MWDLHKMKQENHLSLRSGKVNGMDTLQMFTVKCFLSLWAIEFVHKRRFALFLQSHNPICFRLTRVTSTSLEHHSSSTEQGLVLLNYFAAIMKCYSAALEGTRLQMQVLAFYYINRSTPRQDSYLNLIQIRRVAENHAISTRYPDLAHQNTRPKYVAKKTGVNSMSGITGNHTHQGTKQPCHEAPQLSSSCSSVPLCPQLRQSPNVPHSCRLKSASAALGWVLFEMA